MRSFQEFKGQSTRIDYDRKRAEFVVRPVSHPFTTRNAVSEVQNGHKKPGGSRSIDAASPPRARAGKILRFIAPVRSLAASNHAMEPKTQQHPSRDELAGCEYRVWNSVVGLALAGIVMWVGFLVS